MSLAAKGLIVRHIQVNENMYEMEVRVPNIASISNPGQFVHIKIGSNHHPLLRRPLSLYDVDKSAGSISLLYKVVGEGTQMLTHLKNGDSLDIMGPLGKPFTCAPSKSRALVIGGGVGIAPLVYLSRTLIEQGCQLKVLYGSENISQLVAWDRLVKIGAEILPATMDGSAGCQGLVTDLLANLINPSQVDYIYTCGPEAMMAAVAEYAKEHGIAGEVSLEEFMACGVGACLGCARKLKENDEFYVKVCKDGPVFAMQEVQLYKC